MKVMRVAGKPVAIPDSLNWPGAETLPDPTVADLAVNFAGATARFVEAGFPIVSRADYEARREACQACPNWDAKGFLGLFGQCKACGCTKLKLGMATERCPKGRWPVQGS